jgi:hypothetical protein
MGIIKWLIQKFSCQSSCKFNIEDQMFDMKLHTMSLENFDLKHKDILKIHRILNKRDIKVSFPKKTFI